MCVSACTCVYVCVCMHVCVSDCKCVHTAWDRCMHPSPHGTGACTPHMCDVLTEHTARAWVI